MIKKICFGQIDTTVGDVAGNVKKIISAVSSAKAAGAQLIVFPEMTITGYPPKDLLYDHAFIAQNMKSIDDVRAASKGITIILGYVEEEAGKLFNSAIVISDQKILGSQKKTHLPNYDVFDEKRYFAQSNHMKIFKVEGLNLGVTICEDIWEDGPVEELKKQGAELIINISASPFQDGKESLREDVLRKRSANNHIPMVYCNLVGSQDDIIFDGHGYYYDQNGNKIFETESFKEDLFYFEHGKKYPVNKIDSDEQMLKALVLGIKDYFGKNNFKRAILGLSGGIDSALTAVLAVEALGKENVVGITMPSKYSSSGSVDDSILLARNLGIEIKNISIKRIFDAYIEEFKIDFKDGAAGVTEENIQARIRGNILMAFSNKYGFIVLSTGNKSELAVGYCTLYGDMSGGLAVISDVYKTKVYSLAKYYNRIKGEQIIPENCITKAPSAELRPNQKDSDSLPEYDLLDQIIELFIEEKLSREEIIQRKFDSAVVDRVLTLINRNEYKRQQAALGLKVTSKAFGSGRRSPITNGWDPNKYK